MTKQDIDFLAFYDRPMPDGAGEKDMLYYYAVRALYVEYHAKRLSQSKAGELKARYASYLDRTEGLAFSSSKLIAELDRSTEPRANLGKKTKAELIEIITRFEALLMNLSKQYEDDIPEMLKKNMEEKE